MAGVVVVICLLVALTWFIVRRIPLARRSRGDTISGLGGEGVDGEERKTVRKPSPEANKGDAEMRPPNYKP
jgi:hypothetical protein